MLEQKSYRDRTNFSFGVKPEDLFRVSYKDIGGGNSKVDGVKRIA